MKFSGHDYRRDHFTTPRTIDNYYPDRGASPDMRIFWLAVGIAVVLVALWAIGVNL